MGKKLLRRRIFAPSAKVSKIEAWLDYLDTMIIFSTGELSGLRTRLQEISNIDIAVRRLGF